MKIFFEIEKMSKNEVRNIKAKCTNTFIHICRILVLTVSVIIIWNTFTNLRDISSDISFDTNF